jgi:serine/threonine protein kinase
MDVLQPSDPAKVGRYRLLGRLGEGGMGRVFLGVSPGGRQVAVKLIHPGRAGKNFRERFAREIAAARQVGGFHTAPVVDADPGADPPWMVTAYIPGPSLTDAVTERGPFGVNELCTLGAGLAEGLAAIHACGLVHRDLKPSNVILAEDGPRIIDFGIARAAEDSGMTTDGAVVGTFAFMSPEQIRGDHVGPASDVFSLGCTLAFAATSHAPFGEESIVTVATRITGEPPDLAGVTDEGGFRQLVTECLAKAPADRPDLTDILARLTGSVLDDAADQTPDHEVPWYERTGNKTRDDLNSADQTATSEVSHRDPPVKHTLEPDPSRLQAEQSGRHRSGRRVLIAAGVAVIVLLAAGLAILLTRGSPAKTHQAAVLPSPRPSPPHSIPSPVGPPPVQPDATLHDPRAKVIYGVVFSSDTALATGDSNGNLYLWSVTGTLNATLHDPGSQGVLGVALRPKGDAIAAADNNGSSYVWNMATHGLTTTLTDPGGKAAVAVAFSPNGNSIATADDNGTTYLWNVATGEITATLADPGSKGVFDVAFSPNGNSIATADDNGTTYLWNAAPGKRLFTFKDPGSKGIFGTAFSPNGGLLATSDYTGSLYLWNTATGKIVSRLQAPGSIGGGGVPAFSPNGGFLAVPNGDGSIYVWDVATGQLIGTLKDPKSKGVDAVAFSPDGSFLATGDTNGSTYLWDMSWLGS